MTKFVIPYGLWTTPRHYLPIWLMPLSNAPQCPGFQELEQETAPAASDFWNPTLTAHMRVLNLRNPDKKG